MRERWDEWYSNEDPCSSFRAIRRAKLRSVLRFYADKAHRHYLPQEQYEVITSEIDRMIEKGGDYYLSGNGREATADGCSALSTLAPAPWRSLLRTGIHGYSCSGRAFCPTRTLRRESIVLRPEGGAQGPVDPPGPQDGRRSRARCRLALRNKRRGSAMNGSEETAASGEDAASALELRSLGLFGNGSASRVLKSDGR